MTSASIPHRKVLVVGGGPAGATCAALCASAGLAVTVLERARFPREKVCGDCLNPIAWPVLERLGVVVAIRNSSHASLRRVQFVACDGTSVDVGVTTKGLGEIGLKRSILDDLLLQRARTCGATVEEGAAVTHIARTNGGWSVRANEREWTADILVAADGRNSSVARLLGLMPAARKDRVGLQTHIPLPDDMPETVRMQFVPEGYSGLADVGAGTGNLCLVARPRHLDRLREWAHSRYQLPASQEWRSITPLSRAVVHGDQENLLLTGDVARVVEPFTGEGISYALLSGALAADCIAAGNLRAYPARHAAMYRGRLWVNVVAKQACLHPHVASALVRISRSVPGLLALLTRKVVGSPQVYL